MHELNFAWTYKHTTWNTASALGKAAGLSSIILTSESLEFNRDSKVHVHTMQIETLEPHQVAWSLIVGAHELKVRPKLGLY